MPPAQNQMPVQNRDEGSGPIVGAIIVVILVVFGALYFWGQKLNQVPAQSAPLSQIQVSD